MNHTDAIEIMLNNLDLWRNLPKYQLERRVDLFFGMFIRQIVAGYLGCPVERINALVIPEFPFRYNVNMTDTNHTVNFDYVLFLDDLTTMYIVELKTDPDSYREAQTAYLNRAVQTGFSGIILGLNKVFAATATSKHGKYEYLRGLLANVGLVSKDGELKSINSPLIRLLYLGPVPSDAYVAKKLSEKLITLETAADILERTGGAVECRFAEFLKRCEESPAGRIP